MIPSKNIVLVGKKRSKLQLQMKHCELFQHCEAEVIIDRPPIRTRNTTTGAPSFATHQRMSTKSWRPSSARNDTNTPMGQHYTLGAAAPKPYNGEKDSYLDVVARGSVDLDLQTETGIISSLEYDEFDDSLQVRRLSVSCIVSVSVSVSESISLSVSELVSVSV